MATESPAMETVTIQGTDDDAWLGQVLPIVRVRKYQILTFFPYRQEIVALYRDEIVAVRKWKSVPIPEEVYEPGGAEALLALRGHKASMKLDEVTSLTSWPRSYFGVCDGLRASGQGKAFRFRVEQAETPNLYRALGLVLGPRFHEKRSRPALGSRAMQVALVAAIAAAVVASFANVGAIIHALVAPILWIAAAVLLLLGLISWIPGRRPSPRKVKARPLKDLSGRQPVRLRVAGVALSALGSILVIAFFGDLFFQSILPLLPGGAQVAASWYMKVLLLSVPIFVVVAGGSAVMSSNIGMLPIVLVTIYFLIFAAIGVFTLVTQPSVELFYQLLFVASPYIGLLLIHTGRRMISRNAVAVVAGDPRPPVLYLRSFEDDVEDTLTPHTGLANFFSLTLPPAVRRLPLPIRVIYEAQPLRVLRSIFGRVTPTTELQLAAYFRKVGPFIAIGKPGERLATIGAAREYVDDSRWQEVVLDFLRRSQYVVLQAAGTRGFLWELTTVLSTVEPRKLLFCLSNFRGRQNDYEDFRLKADSVHGWNLPRSVGNRDEPQFLFFEEDRTPILHAVSYRSPTLWPVLAGVTDLDHTLARFLNRDSPPSAPYQPRRYPGHGFLALVLSLVIAPALGGLILFLVLSASSRLFPTRKPPALPFLGRPVPEFEVEFGPTQSGEAPAFETPSDPIEPVEAPKSGAAPPLDPGEAPKSPSGDGSPIPPPK